MKKYMGSDTTVDGLKFHFTNNIRPVGRRQVDLVERGGDPKAVDISSLRQSNKGQKGSGFVSRRRSTIFFSFLYSFRMSKSRLLTAHLAISNYFGTDSTPGGIGFQFRTIKADAKRQRDCFNNGGDPQTLSIGGGKGTSSFLRFLSAHCQHTSTHDS